MEHYLTFHFPKSIVVWIVSFFVGYLVFQVAYQHCKILYNFLCRPFKRKRAVKKQMLRLTHLFGKLSAIQFKYGKGGTDDYNHPEAQEIISHIVGCAMYILILSPHNRFAENTYQVYRRYMTTDPPPKKK